MSVNTRHSSVEALKEKYQQSRQRAIENNQSSPATVYEEEEEEEEEEKDEEAEDEEEEEEEEKDDDNDSFYSSTSSIPDEDIDFDLVYALHTFVATLDGQASVVKGDAMTLLDDTNSYWWLVKALKTSEVGYIPAENIETPFERLARLNKHRNVEVTLPAAHLPEYTKNSNKKQSSKKKVKMSRKLACQLQVIFTEEDDVGPIYERWEEEMSTESLVEEEEEEEVENKSPLLNPEFNKSIQSPEDQSSETSKNKPKPLVQFEPSELNKNPPVQKPVSGLKRLFSIGNKKERPTEEEEENRQFHVLRIFAGNINVGAMFATVAVTPEMSADQLLKIALEKFHIPLLTTNKSNSIEYYLTVKSMDSDELTMLPQDKPLAIFQSLSDHLTTPMPSLTYIKRLSIEQPTIKVTRVGVSKARQRAKAHFGEDSVIRFALHKRIKRTLDGQTYVKISYYGDCDIKKSSSLIKKSSLLRKDSQPKKSKKERMDKLVAISTLTPISELTTTALEKFHLSPGESETYYMTLLINGRNEKTLPADKLLTDILNDPSWIPKGTIEKFFVLRKNHFVPSTSQSEPISPTDSNRRSVVRKLLKQQDNSGKSSLSNTDNVIKRLDEAIQSLENDKNKMAKNEDFTRRAPIRSNSLSAYYNKGPKNDSDEYKKSTPTRSTSLKLVGDAFDTLNNNGLSNMDDLELELHRIATSS